MQRLDSGAKPEQCRRVQFECRRMVKRKWLVEQKQEAMIKVKGFSYSQAD
jgi:hypothetical protein